MAHTHDTILKGKDVAEHIYKALLPRLSQLKNKGITPCLRVILVGDNPASKIYVHMKAKKCKELGIDGDVILLPESTQTSEIVELIHTLNTDPKVHSILVQLPLPAHIDSDAILSAILPTKDVDGFHEINIGKLQKNATDVPIPCTANAVIEFFKYYNISTEGKHIAIIGRSSIVGRPLSILLSLKQAYGNATVSLCHSKTSEKDITSICSTAHIVIVAIGIPFFLKEHMVAKDAVVIDVGINRIHLDKEGQALHNTTKEYILVGDADFDTLQHKCSYITPVPGGVGAVTIASLMKNTVQLAEQNTAYDTL